MSKQQSEQLNDLRRKFKDLLREDAHIIAGEEWLDKHVNRYIELVEAHLAERTNELEKLYKFEQNHHDALKGIDDYDQFSKGEPNSPERLVAFIHQLSPWNLERGVEMLRELLAGRSAKDRAAIAHAIGYCRGLGYPSSYLEKQYPDIVQLSTTPQTKEEE